MILPLIPLLAQTIVRVHKAFTVSYVATAVLDLNHSQASCSLDSHLAEPRRGRLAPALPRRHFMSRRTSPGGERLD
jgi:hypothetical protein